MNGRLYVVATPIGNLKDITFRAIETLKNVDLIACEDTRHTGKLASHYEISTTLVSYHQHNKIKKADYLIGELKKGKEIGLVTDVGTPGVSDPGYYIIRESVKEDVEIVPIPGPSALVAALTISGFPTREFFFDGFLPTKKGKRRKRLKMLSEKDCTLVLYVSKHKIMKVLKVMKDYFQDRKIVVAREMTKKFEEVVRGEVNKIKKYFSERKIRGEFTFIIAPPGYE